MCASKVGIWKLSRAVYYCNSSPCHLGKSKKPNFMISNHPDPLVKSHVCYSSTLPTSSSSKKKLSLMLRRRLLEEPGIHRGDVLHLVVPLRQRNFYTDLICLQCSVHLTICFRIYHYSPPDPKIVIDKPRLNFGKISWMW